MTLPCDVCMQKLYLVVTFLVVGPHVEGSLHQQLPQFTQVSLQKHPHSHTDGYITGQQRPLFYVHDQLQVRLYRTSCEGKVCNP